MAREEALTSVGQASGEVLQDVDVTDLKMGLPPADKYKNGGLWAFEKCVDGTEVKAVASFGLREVRFQAASEKLDPSNFQLFPMRGGICSVNIKCIKVNIKVHKKSMIFRDVVLASEMPRIGKEVLFFL